jgi:DNA-binding NarL/FixJ family response regulator
VTRSGRISVVLIEDNDVFRESLELVLGLADDLEIVGTVGSGSEGVALCGNLRPSVALVDYRLPDLDGVETAQAIREASPGTAILALTAGAGEPEVAALLAAGASGCLLKDRAAADIVAAIRGAAASS